MQSPLPVIRTYSGTDRQAAEAAYRSDVRTARAAGWVPVAHRWRTDGDRQELSVVFELHAVDPTGVSEPTPGAVRTGGSPPNDDEAHASTSGIPDDPLAVALPRDDVAPEDTAASFSGQTRPTGMPAMAGLGAARAHSRTTLETIDLHAGGEPIRLIRSGYPQVPLAPILERRRWALEHADAARRTLMYEPRGHRDMYGAVLLAPFRPDADIAVLFMHNEGYSTMCGHGVIALTTGLIEEGLYPAALPATTVRWETPAGLVTAVATVTTGEDGGPEVSDVRFTNVPSYLHETDIEVSVDGHGPIRVQLAFGGAYYGIVDAADLGLRVVPDAVEALTAAGAAITGGAPRSPLADASHRCRPWLRLRHHHRRP